LSAQLSPKERKDIEEGPTNNLEAYAWANESDLAFGQLIILIKTPNDLLQYGSLKVDPGWDPLRRDPRFDKLLAKLAPHD
jgi:hypothetical protein